MSAAPITPPESPELWADALKAAPLGAAAMLARGLLSTERLSWAWIARSAAAAAVVSVVAGMALRDYVASESLRYACIGLAGFASPEIVDAAIRWVKAKAAAKVAEAEAQVKPPTPPAPSPHRGKGKPQNKTPRAGRRG